MRVIVARKTYVAGESKGFDGGRNIGIVGPVQAQIFNNMVHVATFCFAIYYAVHMFIVHAMLFSFVKVSKVSGSAVTI